MTLIWSMSDIITSFILPDVIEASGAILKSFPHCDELANATVNGVRFIVCPSMSKWIREACT